MAYHSNFRNDVTLRETTELVLLTQDHLVSKSSNHTARGFYTVPFIEFHH